MAVASEKRDAERKKPGPAVNTVGEGYARGAGVPWRFKMALKIALAALPVSYDFWVKLGIFRHGDLGTELPGIQKSFSDHFEFYKERFGTVPGYCLELGPGDSLGHALSGKLAGVKGTWFVDVGDFATKDPEHYRAFYKYLNGPEDKKPASFARDTVLAWTSSVYGSEGLNSMAAVPDGRIDFSYSHAVLEHIRRDEFGAYMKELYRVHKKGGAGRHWVDLHDHLGGALNSMRFSPKFWESRAVGKAGFYTNRLTMKEMIALAEEAGFRVEIPRINKWKALPTPRSVLHPLFSGKSDEELNICTFLMVLVKS